MDKVDPEKDSKRGDDHLENKDNPSTDRKEEDIKVGVSNEDLEKGDEEMKDESRNLDKDDGKGKAGKERMINGLELSEGLNRYLTKEKREKLEEIIQVFE